MTRTVEMASNKPRIVVARVRSNEIHSVTVRRYPCCERESALARTGGREDQRKEFVPVLASVFRFVNTTPIGYCSAAASDRNCSVTSVKS